MGMDVAVITGASSGIGAEVASKLSLAGYEVVLVARRLERLNAVALGIRQARGVAHILQADLSLPASVETVIPAALRLTGGRLHVLVNCAGVVGGISIESDPLHVQEIMQINLLAPIQLMRCVIPHLVEQQHGAVLNVGSMAGELGVRGIYSASKFGLRGITYSVRRELRGTGVHICLIEPGRVVESEVSGGSRASGVTARVVADAIVGSLDPRRRGRRRVFVPRRGAIAALLESLLPVTLDRANRSVWTRRTN